MKNSMKIFTLLSFLFVSIIFKDRIFANTFENTIPTLKQRVVLLISVSNLAKERFQPMAETVAKDFYDIFSKNYDVRTIFQAEQADLFQALNDKNNLAVFWMSHSDSAQGFSGTNLNGQIVDAKNIDVTQIFTQFHSKLRWLGVIGCKSLPIFKRFINEDIYSGKKVTLIDVAMKFNSLFWLNKSDIENSNEDIVIATSSELSEAIYDSHRNFTKAYEFLFKKKINENFSEDNNLIYFQNKLENKKLNNFDLKIIRNPEINNSDLLSSIQILWHNKILYVFPESNETQEVQLFIPLNQNEKNEDIKFVVDSGLTSEHKEKIIPHLGVFTIYSNSLKKEWDVLKINNIPLGINQHIYKIHSTN